MNEITITLPIPQKWENAAWYEGKQIDTKWVQEKIEEALSCMGEYCGVDLNKPQEEFREGITAFRKHQTKADQERRKQWEDPAYRQAQYEMLTQDDLPKIREVFENVAREARETLRRA